jgi:hypothetical protein
MEIMVKVTVHHQGGHDRAQALADRACTNINDALKVCQFLEFDNTFVDEVDVGIIEVFTSPNK